VPPASKRATYQRAVLERALAELAGLLHRAGPDELVDVVVALVAARVRHGPPVAREAHRGYLVLEPADPRQLERRRRRVERVDLDDVAEPVRLVAVAVDQQVETRVAAVHADDAAERRLHVAALLGSQLGRRRLTEVVVAHREGGDPVVVHAGLLLLLDPRLRRVGHERRPGRHRVAPGDSTSAVYPGATVSPRWVAAGSGTDAKPSIGPFGRPRRPPGPGSCRPSPSPSDPASAARVPPRPATKPSDAAAPRASAAAAGSSPPR
jgi:hypothetical protein